MKKLKKDTDLIFISRRVVGGTFIDNRNCRQKGGRQFASWRELKKFILKLHIT